MGRIYLSIVDPGKADDSGLGIGDLELCTPDYFHRGTILAILVMVFFHLMAKPAIARADVGLPGPLREVGIDQRLNQQVPLELRFRDEAGRAVKLEEFFGRRPVVLALVYYECPMLCTQVLNGLVKTLKVLPMEVGNQFDIVAVSFNPRETPALAAAKKAAYIQRYGRSPAAAGWHFLTGEEKAIGALTGAVGFRYVFDPDSQQYAHASGLIVLTPEGRISRYFYGIEYSARDLRLGLVEASANKIGSPVDQLLLFCFRYDPTTGKYSAVVMNIVRLGGLLTVLGIGIMLVALRRRVKEKKVG